MAEWTPEVRDLENKDSLMKNPESEISRRSFHRRVALAATGISGFFQGIIVNAEPNAKSMRANSKMYIDIHVHLGQPWNKRGPLTPEMLLGWMDAHEIAQAWVHPLISPESWYYPMTPQWVLEQIDPYRDRLIPFCSVDPRTVSLGGKAGYVDILRRYMDAGAKGFGEHKWGGAIDDPRNIELFHVCAELKLPVLFHMDNHRNTDKPGLPGFENVLREVPDCIFLAHSWGWWASLSGDAVQADFQGSVRRPVTPGGAIDRLMDKYPNVYGDLSAPSAVSALRRDLDFTRDFIVRRADRLMFGTDYLSLERVVEQFELFDSLKLPPDVQAKVFRDNAQNLLQG